jgi:DNA-directed RNA polymerase subunit RPC12/RpoP
MTIYECDMCGRQFRNEFDVHEILVHESDTPLPFGDGEQRLLVCLGCSRRLYEYIRKCRAFDAAINKVADAPEGRT